MQKVITTLKDILTPLCKNRKDIWANENWIHVFSEWPPIACEDIEALFRLAKTEPEPIEMDFSESERGKVIYLPPLEKDPDCVPILSLYFNLKEPQSIAKLRVLLVRVDENRKPHGIYGIGFRMETPEKINQGVNSSVNSQHVDTVNNSGSHDFHHAQLIRKFGQRKLDNKLQIDCPIWLPQSQPSFPLPAECPVTLLICLLVTLYGRKYYNQFLTDHNIFEIKQYQQELNRWINQ
ncbi:hypothetical protein F4Y43_01255 [Candidatus Poribacteria bacterium]|nr:hypothetical protein [Candidatus Poribacteria bacterium]